MEPWKHRRSVLTCASSPSGREAAPSPCSSSTLTALIASGIHPIVRSTRLLARLFAGSLDRRLAAGRPPEASRLLAARAQVLASPAMRAALATDLARIGAGSRQTPVMRSPKVPLNRAGVIACAPLLQQAFDALVAPRPTLARGVAVISCLLSDGTGPLYDRRRSGELPDTLSEAIAQL